MDVEGTRNLSWVNTISQTADSDKSASFSAKELSEQENLFGHRAALFFTPTTCIPPELIGSGRLDVRLPVASPDYNENVVNRAGKSPRFWVDLIQRQTFKIRWEQIYSARVSITRYDYYTVRLDHLAHSIKAPLDALKVATSGRRDGNRLYYFGAIIDDGPADIDIEWKQELVDHPRMAGIRIEVDSHRPKLTSQDDATPNRVRAGI